MHKVEVFVRAVDEAFGVRLLTVINGSRLDTEFEGPRAILFVSATDTYHIIVPLGSSDELHIGASNERPTGPIRDFTSASWDSSTRWNNLLSALP
jgi:hypothetical protein